MMDLYKLTLQGHQQLFISRFQGDDDIDVPASTEKNDAKGHTNEALTSDTQI